MATEQIVACYNAINSFPRGPFAIMRRITDRRRGRHHTAAGIMNKVANIISPYAKDTHRNEDYAFQTVYEQTQRKFRGSGRKKRNRGGARKSRFGKGIGTSIAKQAYKVVKGYNDIMSAGPSLKQPNRALWGGAIPAKETHIKPRGNGDFPNAFFKNGKTRIC